MQDDVRAAPFTPEQLALHETVERLSLAVEAGGLGTWDYDPHTGNLTWDDRCRELFDMPEGAPDTYEVFLSRLHSEDRDRVDATVRAATATGSSGRYEIEYRTAGEDGSVRRWIAARGRTMFDPEGRAIRMLGVCRDVTARKRSETLQAEMFAREQEARLQVEAASRAKDEFLAMISHELRTPLNSMLGWARLLKTGNLDRPTFERAIETIERNVKSQAKLIEDLLDVSRIISGRLRINSHAVDPVAVLEAALDTARPSAEAKGITLSVDAVSAPPTVLGDAERLQQVVWNLLSNAVKFTDKGGSISVRLDATDRNVEISVTDSGQGIRPEFLPHVFDPFRQADGTSARAHKGLGLGLSIVRHLVELHGGRVSAESDGAGHGATFRVTLPVLDGSASARTETETVSGSAPSPSPSLLENVRVLLVDDELDTRDLLSVALTQCGATVVAAGSAAEARTRLDAGDFDVLISDIAMPAEDGYSLIRSVRSRGAANKGLLPAVALTAFARTEDRVHALAAGFQMHVAKPVEPIELAMTIRNLVGIAGRVTARTSSLSS